MEKYDVVLSFAGQDRKHAKDLADLLKSSGYSFFYDENERADLWGKDLYEHLSSVYKDQGHYCVMFLSEHYARELWPNHERRSAQARAFQENREYILPVRLDDTEIQGISPTVAYLDLRLLTIEEIYNDLVKKLSSTAARKTSSDDNNAPHPESGKEKSSNHEHNQNVNAEDSKTSLGQENVSEKGPHGNASNGPLKGFITYSHEDTTQKDELRKRLAVMEQNNELITWDDGQLTPGDGALQEDILEKVADSDLLLYLVSAESLDSKNCNRELAKASKEELRIIPIILGDCDWSRHRISNFEVLPYKGKPINEWQPESKGWQNVIEGIRKVIKKMQYQSQPSPTVTPEEKETLAFLALQRGNFMMMLDQIGEALKDYSRSIELYPNYAQAYSNRSAVYLAKGKYSMTVEDCNKAIALKSNYADAYNNRGAAYGAMGNIKQSIKDCTTAIQFKPKYASAFTNRGNAYQLQGNFKNAIKDYDKAIQLEPNYAVAYSNRGSAYAEKGEHDEAIKDFSKAIHLNPNYAGAYNNRGTAHREKGELDLAILDLNIAIHLKPNYADAYYNRGTAYFEKDRIDSAIEDYTKAIELKEDFAIAYYNRGISYYHKNKINAAIEDFTTAIQFKPDNAQTYYNRGLAYNKKGKINAAIADFTKAIQLNPNFTELYYSRGNLYNEKDEADLAITDYTMAIQLKPDYAEVYNNRGVSYDQKGEMDLAITDYTKSIQLKPDIAKAYTNRGMAYGKKGKVDLAIEDFTTAIQLKPDYAEAYIYRGITWLHLQEWEIFKSDVVDASNIGVDIALGFRNTFKNVANFERITGIQLPADIAAILISPQA